MRFLYSLLICFCVATPALAEEKTETKDDLPETGHWIETNKVILRGLDKVSARVFTSEVFVNQKVHFGSLEIYVRSANRAPPEEKPDSVCFLEIYDNKQGQQRQKVFSGWMFSSNPALTALEHPVYDIWVKEAVLQADGEEAQNAANLNPQPIKTEAFKENDEHEAED